MIKPARGVPAGRPKAPPPSTLLVPTPGSFTVPPAGPPLFLQPHLPLPFRTIASSRWATVPRIGGTSMAQDDPSPAWPGVWEWEFLLAFPPTRRVVRGNRRTPPEPGKAHPQNPVSFSVTHLIYWRGEALRMYMGPGTSNLPSLFRFHTCVETINSKYVHFHIKYIL